MAETWQDRALRGVSTKDKKVYEQFKEFVQDCSELPRWYYGGAGVDITPTLIAPVKTEHWWVDPVYNLFAGINYTYFNPREMNDDLRAMKLGELIEQPYKRIGCELSLLKPWQEALKQANQTLSVDGQTTIRMMGDLTSVPATRPDSCGAIFSSFATYKPHPSVLKALRIKGKFIDRSPADQHYGLHPERHSLEGSYKLPAELLGFEFVRSFHLDTLFFPAFGKLRINNSGVATIFYVFEKKAEMEAEIYQRIVNMHVREEAQDLDPRSKKWARNFGIKLK